mmetsp:Transcript_24406/g.72389  ORF Transcript_24406/g.72389 Transcript_24406/m.72389 type:complete len:96 (+) Transcript_24406:87-374(+)
MRMPPWAALCFLDTLLPAMLPLTALAVWLVRCHWMARRAYLFECYSTQRGCQLAHARLRSMSRAHAALGSYTSPPDVLPFTTVAAYPLGQHVKPS